MAPGSSQVLFPTQRDTQQINLPFCPISLCQPSCLTEFIPLTCILSAPLQTYPFHILVQVSLKYRNYIYPWLPLTGHSMLLHHPLHEITCPLRSLLKSFFAHLKPSLSIVWLTYPGEETVEIIPLTILNISVRSPLSLPNFSGKDPADAVSPYNSKFSILCKSFSTRNRQFTLAYIEPNLSSMHSACLLTF